MPAPPSVGSAIVKVKAGMKIQVTVVHPVPTATQGPLDHWRIRWNGPGTAGAYTASADQPMSATVVDTGTLAGAEGDTYTVVVDWYDTSGQHAVLVLPTVVLHVTPALPDPPSAGTATATVLA